MLSISLLKNSELNERCMKDVLKEWLGRKEESKA